MLVAGLTGSIATGKSTVSFILKDLGAFIVDADASAREVVAPGMRAWDKIIEIFGKDILQKTGEIDREHLGRLVFNDAAMRRMLEEVVHPEVIRAMNERIELHQGRLPGCGGHSRCAAAHRDGYAQGPE